MAFRIASTSRSARDDIDNHAKADLINRGFGGNITVVKFVRDAMTDSDLINKLGGTNKVAELCDVRPQAVSQWRVAGIPDARRKFLAAIYPGVVRYSPKYRRAA